MRKRIKRKADLVLSTTHGKYNYLKVEVVHPYFEKIEYGLKYIGIRDIINFYDPMHLLWVADEDEYSIEVDLILERMNQNMNKQELFKIVYEVFVQKFGGQEVTLHERIKSTYMDIAVDIYNWMLFGP